MPKYPGISPYDNEKGTLGTAKKRWEKLYVKEIESDTVSGINATIENLATTAENSVSAAVSAKNDAVAAKTAAQAAQTAAETAAAGIQSVAETDVDNTLSIAGVAADAKVTGDWLRDIAKPVTGDTSLPGPCDEFLQYIEDAEHRLLFAIKRDGTVDWQKGTPKHVVEACNPTMESDEYLYLIKDTEDKVLFGIKKNGSVYWQKGLPKWLEERINQDTIDSDEFVQFTQDSEEKLIEGVTANGTKCFFSPIRIDNKVTLSSLALKSLEEALKENNSDLSFNYKPYIKATINGSVSSGLEVLYLEGDMSGISKDNKVDMEYEFRGNKGTCTLKWQGASSVAFPKKNYTIAKMNPSIDIGWGLQKKYVLKADFSDCSHARNILCAKLWGDIVKSRTPVNERLSALPNGGAIDGFPIMLVINNEYQGLYNFNIPKDPWMLGMGDGEYEAMITAETHAPTTRFKETVSREDILAAKYWEIEYIPDEDSPDWAIDSFNRMITAVMNSTGVNYRETLESYLDIESAIDYYIHLCLTGNSDGVDHNFIMCTYDGVKWFFNAYDMDWTFGSSGWSTSFISPKSAMTFAAAQGVNRVMHLIYRYDTDRLKARYNELRNSSLSEDNVINKLSNFLVNVPSAILDRDSQIWPTTPGTLMNNYEQIVNWYRIRVQYMDEEINNL